MLLVLDVPSAQPFVALVGLHHMHERIHVNVRQWGTLERLSIAIGSYGILQRD